MAQRIHPGGTRRFERLSRLERFDVEEGDIDPRGWTVTTPAGDTLGEVKDLIIDTERMRGTYLDVELDTRQFSLRDDPHVLVPVDRANRDRNHRRLVVDGLGRDRVLELVAAREAASMAFWDRWWGRDGATGVQPHRQEPVPHTASVPHTTSAGEPQRVAARVSPPVEPGPVDPADIRRAVDQVAPGQTVRIPVVHEDLVRDEIVTGRRPVADAERLVAREDAGEDLLTPSDRPNPEDRLRDRR